MNLQYYNYPMREVYREFISRLAAVENAPDAHQIGAQLVEVIEGRLSREEFDRRYIHANPDPHMQQWLTEAYLILSHPMVQALDYIETLLSAPRQLYFDSWSAQGDLMVVCNPKV